MSKYDESIERIEVGSVVASRQTGRVIGTVDEVAGEGGSRWALVSWPAVDMPHARTDDRGRRCQVFNLTALRVGQDKSERAWLNAEVVCEWDGCGKHAAFEDEITGKAACDWHVLTPEAQRAELADQPGDLTGEDYDRLFGPPEPGNPDFEPWDCGGVWDGFQVVSDADPGL